MLDEMKGENGRQARRVWRKPACEKHPISRCGVKLHEEHGRIRTRRMARLVLQVTENLLAECKGCPRGTEGSRQVRRPIGPSKGE